MYRTFYRQICEDAKDARDAENAYYLGFRMLNRRGGELGGCISFMLGGFKLETGKWMCIYQAHVFVIEDCSSCNRYDVSVSRLTLILELPEMRQLINC